MSAFDRNGLRKSLTTLSLKSYKHIVIIPLCLGETHAVSTN